MHEVTMFIQHHGVAVAGKAEAPVQGAVGRRDGAIGPFRRCTNTLTPGPSEAHDAVEQASAGVHTVSGPIVHKEVEADP